MSATNDSSAKKYCTNCGSQIPANMQFCPTCGAPQNGGYQQQYQNTRDNTLKELARMHDYFAQKQSEYNEFDRLNAALPAMNHVGFKPLLIFGIIIVTISFMIFAAGSNGLGFVALLIGGSMIGGFIAIEVNRKKRVQNTKDRIDEIALSLMDHYQKYGNCPLDVDSTYPQNIAELYDLVKSGRADTLKEALNIQINDARMNQMSQMAHATMINSAQAARAAGAAAVASGINAGINAFKQ